MNGYKFAKSVLIVCVVVATMVTIVLAFSGRASKGTVVIGQSVADKKISRRMHKDEVLEFDDLKIKAKKIKLDQGFQHDSEDENWLEGLELKLKNKSEKPVVFISIDLAFPETGNVAPMRVYDVNIGQRPGSPRQLANSIFIIPNDVIHYSLSNVELSNIKAFLSRGNFTLKGISKLEIRVTTVIFSDGMKWYEGEWFRPNPSVPSGYEKVS